MTSQGGSIGEATEVVIRSLDHPGDFRRCQNIQRQAWGITEDGYVLPVALMVSVQRYGGLVLGAFVSDPSSTNLSPARQCLVGFAVAFLAQVEARPALFSQVTAVLPPFQGQGIGYRLKQAQREEARRRGLSLVAWTFDPLQAGNAHFNLARLGACCRRYEEDLYGPRPDPLNAGLATDRLLAEWTVDSPPPAPPEPGEPLLALVPDGEDVRPEPLGLPPAERLELDIPPSIIALKQRRLDLAQLWQERVRSAFRQAFACGYIARGFGRSPDGRRCWYVLEREASDAHRSR